MPRYAKRTTVSVEKTKGEIERTLRRYGAGGFAYAWQDDDDACKAAISFKMAQRQVCIKIALPSREEFRYTPSRERERSIQAVEKEWEQACRQRWRALNLVIKAKLEAIEAEISTFEIEFLPFLVTARGPTVADILVPELDKVLLEGKAPMLLMAPKE